MSAGLNLALAMLEMNKTADDIRRNERLVDGLSPEDQNYALAEAVGTLAAIIVNTARESPFAAATIEKHKRSLYLQRNQAEEVFARLTGGDTGE